METSSGFQSDWNMNPTICRLCLHSDGFLLGIFNHLHGKDKNIYKKIIDCTALEISSGDGLPHTICHRCLFKLELCLDFRAQCFVSDSTLRQASRLAHAQRASTSNNTAGAHAPLSLMDLVPPQVGDSGDVVVVVDPSAVDYDSDYDGKYGRSDATEHYEQPAMAQMAPNIGHYGHPMMMNHVPNDRQIIHEQIPSDNETNEIADNGGEIYDFRNVFMCRYCDRAFTDKSQCTRHESDDHDPAEPYSCKTCQVTFPDRLHYSAHLKSLHADDKPYDCPECEKMFARRSDLRKHTIVHTGIKPFTCPVCSKSFSRNTNLSKHMRIHAGHKPFVCPRCPKTFITRGDLQRHSLIHSGRKPFPCRYCNLSFSRRDKLLRHEKRHFPAGVPGPAAGISGGGNKKSGGKNCAYSGENMVIDIDPIYTGAHDTSASLDNTVAEIKTNVHNFDSSTVTANDNGQDDHFFSGNNDNTAHKKRKHTKSNLMGHVTTDRNEEQEEEELQEEEEEAEKEQELERELTPMEKAAKSKRYPCLQCNRRFSNMDGLKLHIYQYHKTTANTAGRPYQCAQCPKGFVRKRELDRHVTTHSGAKPFGCTSCDKRFGRKDKLARHMRIHDGSNLHVCPICNVAFTRKDSLWQHMRNHQREQQQYHASQQHLTSKPLNTDSSANQQSTVIDTPPLPTTKHATTSRESPEQNERNTSGNSGSAADVTALLDPDFIDAKMDDETEPIAAEQTKRTDSDHAQTTGADGAAANDRVETERSSEFEVEDDDEEEEEEEGEEDDEYEEEGVRREQQESAPKLVEIDDDKELIDRQDENSNSENRNIQTNCGDPDYDEDLDLDENDEEMVEDDDDEEDGRRQDGVHAVDAVDKRQTPQQDDEIIDCDADSFDEDDSSNQHGGQHGGGQQVSQQQTIEPKDDVERQEVGHNDLDDDLDDDFDDDYDDDVQMTATPHSIIF